MNKYEIGLTSREISAQKVIRGVIMLWRRECERVYRILMYLLMRIIWSKSTQRSKDELSTNVPVLKHESLRESNLTAEKVSGVIHP